MFFLKLDKCKKTSILFKYYNIFWVFLNTSVELNYSFLSDKQKKINSANNLLCYLRAAFVVELPLVVQSSTK